MLETGSRNVAETQRSSTLLTRANFVPLPCHSAGVRTRVQAHGAQAQADARGQRIERRQTGSGALYYEKRLAARRSMVNTPTRYGAARTRTWCESIDSGKS